MHCVLIDLDVDPIEAAINAVVTIPDLSLLLHPETHEARLVGTAPDYDLAGVQIDPGDAHVFDAETGAAVHARLRRGKAGRRSLITCRRSSPRRR